MSSRVINELTRVYSWDFDIYALQEMTPSPLLTLLTHCLQEYHLIDSLGFNPLKFHHFIHDIIDSYNPLPYHNSLHAADVTQTTFYFLSTGHVLDALVLNQLSVASILIAAAVHDVNHPGLNGKFLITTHSPLAIEYSDHSPLEMMHLAVTFKLWREEKNNFTEGTLQYNGSMIYREMRRLIIEMVLLTDNDMHFSLLNKLDRVVTMKASSLAQEAGGITGGGGGSSTEPHISNGSSEMLLASSLSSRNPLTHPTIDDRQLLLLQVTLPSYSLSPSP
jgi:cAMP-specific phosphodiesterase 4